MHPSSQPLRFTCLRCKNCCMFSVIEECPVVYSFEKDYLEELSRELGVTLRFTPLRHSSDGTPILYRWIIRGRCPFNDNGLCLIHDRKPLSCRMFPLLIDVANGKVMLSSNCTWVKRHSAYIKDLEDNPELLFQLFPEEMEAALTAFVLFHKLKNGERSPPSEH